VISSITREELLEKVKAKLKRRGALTKEERIYLRDDGSSGWRKRLLNPKKLESLSNEELYGYWKAKTARAKRNAKATKKKKGIANSYKEKYYAYLNTDHWKLVRDGLFYRRGKQCERCGSVSNIQVHHKTYDNGFSEVGDD